MPSLTGQPAMPMLADGSAGNGAAMAGIQNGPAHTWPLGHDHPSVAALFAPPAGAPQAKVVPMEADQAAKAMMGVFAPGHADQSTPPKRGRPAGKVKQSTVKVKQSKVKQANAIAAGKSKAKISGEVKALAGKKAGAKAATEPVTRKLPFPGVPKSPKEPIRVGTKWSIYTDVNHNAWRLQEKGVRGDDRYSWKVDPKGSWADLMKFLKLK